MKTNKYLEELLERKYIAEENSALYTDANILKLLVNHASGCSMEDVFVKQEWSGNPPYQYYAYLKCDSDMSSLLESIARFGFYLDAVRPDEDGFRVWFAPIKEVYKNA